MNTLQDKKQTHVKQPSFLPLAIKSNFSKNALSPDTPFGPGTESGVIPLPSASDLTTNQPSPTSPIPITPLLSIPQLYTGLLFFKLLNGELTGMLVCLAVPQQSHYIFAIVSLKSLSVAMVADRGSTTN